MKRLRVSFVPVAHVDELEPLRSAYLNQLCEPQAPVLEVMTRDAAYYLVETSAGACGYVIVHATNTLIEFHLERVYWLYADSVMQQAVAQLSLRRALVQQFDALCLASCIPLQTGVRSVGVLARDYEPRPLPEPPGIRFTSRTAKLQDLPAILSIDQQVFTHPERLQSVIAQGEMQLFEDADRLIGFGIMRPLPNNPQVVELGIAVDRPFRVRGYAVYILRAMIEQCREQGLRAIGGCAEDNLSSRHTAERVGLVSRYRLLELTFR